MNELSSLCQAVVENPRDWAYRSVLGDYLEDQGDPRTKLVRLVPQLLSVEPRKEVPMKAFLMRPGDYRYVCVNYPDIPLPRIPEELRVFPDKHFNGKVEKDTRSWSEKNYWGCHNLGRLMSSAYLFAHLRVREVELGDDFYRAEAGWWLNNCRLIDRKKKDVGFWLRKCPCPWNKVGWERKDRFVTHSHYFDLVVRAGHQKFVPCYEAVHAVRHLGFGAYVMLSQKLAFNSDRKRGFFLWLCHDTNELFAKIAPFRESIECQARLKRGHPDPLPLAEIAY